MPSIIDGLFAGRSGIQSHGTAISVLADNIANQNTVGFKQSRPDFVDLLAGSLSGAGGVVTGSGSSIISTTPILNQGTFEFTGRGLDLGIDGNGYFIVEDTSGSGARYYTRAGNFKVDVDGNVLDQNGFRVLGFPANGAGGLRPLNVNVTSQDNVQTQSVTISGNVDASEPEIDPADIPADGDPLSEFSNTATFSTFVDVYDSLGASHTLTAFFFKTGSNEWQVRVVADAGEVDGDAGNARVVGSFNDMEFAPDGTLVGDAEETMTIAWNNGSNESEIEFKFSPFTQFSSASSISSIYQDGTGTGSVVGFNVEEDGTLFATLDNGQTSSVGKIALSIFANAESLNRVGNSLFAQTSRSGEPVVGVPGTGTFGRLEAGALELSTSDIAGDFIKLISIQRGFQGSARIITNIDDLLNEIINLA